MGYEAKYFLYFVCGHWCIGLPLAICCSESIHFNLLRVCTTYAHPPGTIFRLLVPRDYLAHRDSGGPDDVCHDGLHCLRESGDPVADRDAARGRDDFDLSVRGYRFDTDGRAGQLSARARARNGPECVLHIYRSEGHGRVLADGAWCGISVGRHLSSAHVRRYSTKAPCRDSLPASRGGRGRDWPVYRFHWTAQLRDHCAESGDDSDAWQSARA